MAISTGIYQLKNGNWAYRICATINSQKIDTSCRKDVNGNPFKTKTEAKKAREQRLVDLRNGVITDKPRDIKLSDVWKAYIDDYSPNKATATVTKYKSLWDNHVNAKFGSKMISNITVADMYAFLIDLYEEQGYSYKYVESFLKLFYQLFGIAHNMERIEPDRYMRMFVTKNTKLKMPAISQEDEIKYLNVQIFTQEEIQKLDNIFKRGNLYTAFMLGYYLGVRISECFALCWSDIDWKKRKITINKQMNYEKKMFCLGPVKTYASVRIIDIPDILYKHLQKEYDYYLKNNDVLSYRNNEIVMNKVEKNNTYPIQGGDFINRKENGELLTINSIKHWNKVVEEETKIDFEFHSLRRTHISMLVSMNVPPKETMYRVGHKKYETTLKYYTAPTDISSSKMKAAVNALYTKEKTVDIDILGNHLKLPYHILQQLVVEYKIEENNENVQNAV